MTEPAENVQGSLLSHGSDAYSVRTASDVSFFDDSFPGVEPEEEYYIGGFHPVHLGDIFEERYKVLHKLGWGGFGTVWLCHDLCNGPHRFVAVKIIAAEISGEDCRERLSLRLLKDSDQGGLHESLSLPLDHFTLQGPNGVHDVFVHQFHGSPVADITSYPSCDEPAPCLRKRALCAVQAMATLHSKHICHGDFRPSNILTGIASLNNLSEAELRQKLSKTRTVPYYGPSDDDSPAEAANEAAAEAGTPEYLVYPIDWLAIMEDPGKGVEFSSTLNVVDFGESYDVSSPPDSLGIPETYKSPEAILEDEFGMASDLWALGCTIFEIRTGRVLFSCFNPNDVDNVFFKIVQLLGILPEPWWSEGWKARSTYFKTEADENGRFVVEEKICLGKEKSLLEAITRGVLYSRNQDAPYASDEICPEEAELLADLLEKLLRYSPEERISAKEALDHPWFKYGEPAVVQTIDSTDEIKPNCAFWRMISEGWAWLGSFR